jgi:GNAT superfamily N-acetyltransferase
MRSALSAHGMFPDGLTPVPRGKIAAVVTSLDMYARPAPRPEPNAADWRLREVEEPDPDWYLELYRRVGSDWLWFSRLVMPRENLQRILRSPAVRVYALDHQGRDEGLLELDFREPRTCEIAFFGLTPLLIGQGAGRWLMNRAMERAWREGVDRVWVHTCTLDHAAAIPFYVRSGFTPFARHVELADDPRLSGILPGSAAPDVPLLA